MRATGVAFFILLFLLGCGQPPRSYLVDRQLDNRDRVSPSSTEGESRRCDGGSYIVVAGDSLSSIAQRCGLDMDLLAQQNKLFPPYVLYPRQELRLPQNPNKQTHLISQPKWIWPLDQATGYKFVDDTAGVAGLEIYAESGSLVKVVADGEVVYADNSVSNFGLMVIVRHAGGYLTVYAHNRVLQVKEGEQVKQGQVIAHLGQTGLATQPKLYFEARHQGRKVNAQPLLRAP